MRRFLAPLAALGMLVAPAASFAANYTAVPITHAPSARIYADDISWACGGDACQGNSDYGRPLVLCQSLASRTGRLASFLADGRAFGAADLERCNSRAKGMAPVARAN